MKHGLMVTMALLGAACGDEATGTPPGPDAMVPPDAIGDTTAPTTTASPPGSVGFDPPARVTLTANEPATIYYTTDGTEPTAASRSGSSPLDVSGITATHPLRFYAVDDAANAEAVKSEAYTVDRAATLTITTPTSTPVVAVTKQPFGLTLSVANPIFVPALGGNGAVSFDLTVTSGVDRRVFNLKAAVTSTTEGTLDADGSLFGGGSPFRYFGPGALVPSGSVTRTLQFNGLTGTVDPVEIQLELPDAPMLYGGANYKDGIFAIDSSFSGMESQLAATSFFYNLGDNTSNGSIEAAVISADLSTIYLANRSMPSVIAIDTETFEGTLSPSLSVLANSPNGLGCTGGIALSPNEQYLYTVLADGNHMYEGSNAQGDGSAAVTIQLVRLDRATLAEVDRVTLMSADDVNLRYVRARTLAISPDGATAVVPLKGAVAAAVVDLATMTLRDADPVTAGTQLVDLSDAADPNRDVRGVAISADGTTAYLPTWDDGGGLGTAQLELNLTTFAVTARALTNALPDGAATDARIGPDGRLYVLRRSVDAGKNGLLTIDLATGTQTEALLFQALFGLAFTGDGERAFINSAPGQLDVLDLRTLTMLDLDGDAGNGQTGYVNNNLETAHDLILTPY